jgi:hypothetical protein
MTPVFVIYPETYAIYRDHMKDDRFDGERYRRIVDVVSAWEAAVQTHGDPVEKVEVYSENGELSFRAFSKADWDGEVRLDE